MVIEFATSRCYKSHESTQASVAHVSNVIYAPLIAIDTIYVLFIFHKKCIKVTKHDARFVHFVQNIGYTDN